MKDLGALRYFFGLGIARASAGIFISQRKYVLDMLQEFGMLNAKPLKLPLDQHVKLTSDMGVPLEDPEVYRRLVGKLIYLIITRTDISYTVHLHSFFKVLLMSISKLRSMFSDT